MSTKYLDIAQRLAAPFHQSEIKVLTKGGKGMPYVTARVVMNRLDEVIGFENWWDEYIPGENSVTCKLTLRLPDGETITKTDVGAFAGMSDQGDDDKSGFSDAFKRAAVKFSVGRHLYNDGSPIYEQHVNGEVVEEAKPAKHPQGKTNLHPNKSGFHNGQYASPDQVKAFEARLAEKISPVNEMWSEHWYDQDAKDWPNIPACKTDVITKFGADGHLVKWLVETGQIDQDALANVGKPSYFGKYAAIVMHRSKPEAKAMAAELDSYLARTFEAKKEAVYRKYPQLAPDGWLENQAEEQAEANPDRGDAYEGDALDSLDREIQADIDNGLSEKG